MADLKNALDNFKVFSQQIQSFLTLAEALEGLGDLDQAAKEANARLVKAQADASAIEAANTQAIEDANQTADKTINNAKTKADTILTAATAKADEIIATAEKTATDIAGTSASDLAATKAALATASTKLSETNAAITTATADLNTVNESLAQARAKVSQLLNS